MPKLVLIEVLQKHNTMSLKQKLAIIFTSSICFLLRYVTRFCFWLDNRVFVKLGLFVVNVWDWLIITIGLFGEIKATKKVVPSLTLIMRMGIKVRWSMQSKIDLNVIDKYHISFQQTLIAALCIHYKCMNGELIFSRFLYFRQTKNHG